MTELEVHRTLVKSPPELWSEFNNAATLTRLLEPHFGEISITRRTHERRLMWQGRDASGTVDLAESGWGTRVRLTACVTDLVTPEAAQQALVAVLDDVGAAHHRPFSRTEP
jgi:hypothetical protein